jgi:hypothetical protein
MRRFHTLRFHRQSTFTGPCVSANSGQGESMVTPENTMSLAGQHALEDMVEFEMYLLGQSQQTPWPMPPSWHRDTLRS